MDPREALNNFFDFLESNFDIDIGDKRDSLIQEVEDGDNTVSGIIGGVFESRTGDSLSDFLGKLSDIRENEVEPVLQNILEGERTLQQAVQKFGDGELPETSEGGTSDDDPGTIPGVLAGGETIRVNVDGVNRFYQIYEFPQGSGNFVSYQFNDREQLEATLGDNFDINTRSQNWFNQNVLAEADAEEVVGLEGNFAALTNEIMREAALEAGVRDPGLVGRMASDPEIQQIMAQAFVGEWSQAQILAEQRKTSFWQDTLYPGIENFYNRTTNPEQAWREYQRAVRPALSQLGYEPDADGTFNSQLERMLDSGIDANAFLEMTPTFVRATQNAEFASVLNEWAERDLGRDIEFGDWFDLMQGESQPELADVAERAQLEWVSQNQGSRVSDAQIEDLAARSQLSVAEAQQAFSEFNRGILALGDDGLARAGLDRNAILSAAAGIEPGDGRSIDEVRLQIAKVARENDLFDEEKINFFVGFDEQGRPQRPGLQALTPEGA